VLFINAPSSPNIISRLEQISVKSFLKYVSLEFLLGGDEKGSFVVQFSKLNGFLMKEQNNFLKVCFGL